MAAATPAIAALLAAGVPHESFGEEAAEELAHAHGVGKRGWDVAVHPHNLIRLTNAITADIRAI